MVNRRRLLDNFDDYTDEDDIPTVAPVLWTYDLQSASTSFTAENDGGADMFGLAVDANVAGGMVARYTLTNPLALADTNELKVDFKLDVQSASYQVDLEMREGATRCITIGFDSNGGIYYFDGSWHDTGAKWTAATWHELVFVMVGASTFRIKVDGTIYDNSGSPWNNWNAFVTSKSDFVVTTGTAGTGTMYLNNINTREPSVGMQWLMFQSIGEVGGGLDFDPLSEMYGDSTGYMATYTKVNGLRNSRTSSPLTWTQYIPGPDEATTKAVFSIADGVLYSYYGDDGTDSYVWKEGGDDTADITGYIVIDLFTEGTDLYAMTKKADGSEWKAFIYNFGGDSWDDPGGAGAIVLAATSAANDFGRIKGVVDTDFYFIGNDNDVACLFKYDVGVPAITKVATITNYELNTSGFTLLKDDTIMYTTLKKTADSKVFLMKSTDTGANWSEVEEAAWRFIPQAFVLSDSKHWAVETNSQTIYYYDYNINSFLKVFEVGDIGTVGNIAPSGILYIEPASGNSVVYKYQNNAGVIKDCDLEGFGNEEYKTAIWIVSPNDKDLFAQGDVVEFLDGFDTLAFKGKVKDNQFIRGVGQQITANPLKGEILEEPKDTVRSFTTSATDTITIAIVDTMDFLFQDGEIDSNGDFTITYTIEIKTPIKDWAHTARELERAVFLVTPAGEVQMYAHDQIPATGLIWRDSTFRQVNLKESLEVDMRLTRSEVIGAYVEGTSDNVEARRDYIGNAALETTEGVVRISLSRPQLTNDTEVLQLATNRFDIYSGTTRFINLGPIKNQGFIQPGYTIDFSWAERDVTVPQGDYFIAHWKYNLKHDRYSEFWLTDNIITYNEFKTVRGSIGRDNQISETYVFGETETTGDGVVCVQNPVARLRAGTTVWRIPEATDYDFDETDLDAVGNPSLADTWYDLDLSAIIPDGVKSVLFKIIFEDNLVDSKLQFRKNGQSNEIQTSDAETSTGTRDFHLNLEVGVCIVQKLEFMSNIDIADWTDIRIVILAWRL